MPSRARLAFVALGLTLWPLPVYGQESEAVAGQQQAEGEEQSAKSPDWSVPVVIIESQAEADARKRREARAEQRELSDLAAQQGMNEAAQKMADYALYQTILVGIGTILLFYTLWLTRSANRSAIIAASAAESTVYVTRAIGEAQTRAYLYCKSATYRLSKEAVTAVLEIGNAGQSPASDVLIKGTASIQDVGGFQRMPRVLSWVDAGTSESHAQPITAGGAVTEEITFFRDVHFRLHEGEPEEEAKRQVFAHGNELWMDLKVQWLDVFNTRHEFLLELRAVIDASPYNPKKKRSARGPLEFRMNDAVRPSLENPEAPEG